MLNNQKPKPKNRFRKFALWFIGVSLICGLAAAYAYNVSKTITSADISYIDKILQQSGTNIDALMRPSQASFSDEVKIIRAVQSSAFTTAPKVALIALNSPREPKNLYGTDAAYCGDRARYIDKTLRHLGFTTRYASLYFNSDERSFISTMLTKSSLNDVDSHALVEVLTSKGWLIVDTRRHWISLTAAQQPISLEALSDKPLDYFAWSNNKEEGWPLLNRHYYIIYELYSRHGQFYAPYTKYIPDIHWTGFIKHNLRQLTQSDTDQP
jgi:hypothetical protein